MADEVNIHWESEDIPNENLLYMRVHRMWFNPDGGIIPGVFKNMPTPRDGMSTDWQKYARPDETMFNALLVKEGYAQILIVPPNVKHQDLFLKLQREARENNRKL